MIQRSRRTVIFRSALGLIFVAGPLAAATHLAPQPVLPPEASAFMQALAATGYMLPLLWCVEIAGGLLLISGLAVPFALLLLAPVIVNIVAFHIFLAPDAIATAILATALELIVAWRYRAAFRQLFLKPQTNNIAGNPKLNPLGDPEQGIERGKPREAA